MSLVTALLPRLRRLVPYPLRLEAARLRRLPAFLLEAPTFARRRLEPAARAPLAFVLAKEEAPLLRPGARAGTDEQRAKERNISLAVARLDGLLVAPCQILSYHWAVGRPSRLRGFRAGLELRDGRPARGLGGGCCLVSNLLYRLALRGGMRIVERHRHGLDLFPDDARTVPFGCGATVAYNYADLRFENPLDAPVLLALELRDGRGGRSLRGRLLTAGDPGFRVELYEADHRFRREGDQWLRENRIRRRILAAGGAVLVDQEVAHNVARVLYEPGARTAAPAGASEGAPPCCALR